MAYRFCSICGSKLKNRKDGNLGCVRCDFVNYRNPRPTATGLVLYKNKLLLTKRASNPFKGWWDFPGGFVDQRETAEKALIRELKEETGLKIKIKKFFGTYNGTYPSKFDPFSTLNLVFVAESSQKKLEANDDVSASEWFAKKDFPKKIAFDSNQKIIKDFLKIWK